MTGFISIADAKPETHHFLEPLKERAPKELSCALAASFLVSPLVSIIDKAIVQEIAGVGQLMRSMGTATKGMIWSPRAFLGGLSFRMTFGVYFGTYAVANMSEAFLDCYEVEAERERKAWKVSMASTANVGLLAWRDSIFAQRYTPEKPPGKVPFRTVGLFAVRDASTMYATFYVAPKAAQYLIDEYGLNTDIAQISTAFSIPVLAQFITAPVHIYALNLYYMPTVTTLERWNVIKKEMGKVCFARGLRIFPAFGIGSYSNNKFRELFIRQDDEELLLGNRIIRRLTHITTAEDNGSRTSV
jgi:hypothetical protein